MQAQLVGEGLRLAGIDVKHVYASAALRSVETAQGFLEGIVQLIISSFVLSSFMSIELYPQDVCHFLRESFGLNLLSEMYMITSCSLQFFLSHVVQ